MSSQFESYFHFAQKKKKKRCLCPTTRPSVCVEVVFVVAGNSPAAISIKKLISGDCLRSPTTSWVSPDDVLYVRTAHKENTLKVRLKLEPFHHEALWEVPRIWGGNKYCQTRAKRSQYTALACVIFRARIYCGLVSFCSAVKMFTVADLWPSIQRCHDLIVFSFLVLMPAWVLAQIWKWGSELSQKEQTSLA